MESPDRDVWLAVAGAEILPSGNAYLVGDANLDGTVDGLDLVALLVAGELIFGSGFETGGRWAWQSPSPPAKRRTTNPGLTANGHVVGNQGAATKR